MSEDRPSVPADDVGRSPAPSTASLVRRLLVFQFKLLLDGLRDLFLSPASIIAVLVGVLGRGRTDDPFRALLRFGRRSDAWIDLFDTHADTQAAARTDADPAATSGVDTRAAANADARREGDTGVPAGARPEASASALFDAVERAIREEYERGGGRSAVEASLRRLREGRGAARADPDAGQ